MTLFFSWASLGLFTGLGWNLLYGDSTTTATNITIGTISATVLGLLVYLVGQSVLPDGAFFRSFLPAVFGALAGLYTFRKVNGG